MSNDTDTATVELTEQNETSETTETTQDTEIKKLTTEQEIRALTNVHNFLSSFDRVPGSQAADFGRVLDTIAIVANSLIAKSREDAATTETEQSTDESSVTQ